MSITGASLFSGGGVADVGFIQAGINMLWGIEYDPKKYGDRIAKWNESQTGTKVHGMNILEIDPRQLPKVDFLHLSPPCPSFSIANGNKGETETDILLAKKCAEFIEVLRPEYLMIENVLGYIKSLSYKIIVDKLNEHYFMGWDVNHLNSADWGVPQTRKRMIVRAVKGILPPLPKPEKWQGWYQAIEDLLPTLERGDFAPWQKKRLKGTDYSFLIGCSSQNIVIRDTLCPSPVVTANDIGKSRAFLLDGSPKGKRPPTVREDQEPSMTVESGGGSRLNREFLMSANNSTSAVCRDEGEPSQTIQAARTQNNRAYLNGEIVLMNTRCLARFQSMPDSYELPEAKTFATTIIGNGFPTMWAEKLARQLIARRA